MNIDLNALKAIEEQQGIAMEDLLATIANALLFSYREFKEGDAGVKGDDSSKAVSYTHLTLPTNREV